MIVLLVYGEAAQPATLILHGNDGKTWISMVDHGFQRTDPKLLTDIRHVLEELVSVDVKPDGR